MDRAKVSSEGLKEDYISENSNIRRQRKHQERCIRRIIEDKAGSVKENRELEEENRLR